MNNDDTLDAPFDWRDQLTDLQRRRLAEQEATLRRRSALEHQRKVAEAVEALASANKRA